LRRNQFKKKQPLSKERLSS